MNYLQSLPDGWTIYVWMVAGGLIIIAAIFGIRWASRNEQFDEDIKYLVFDENDRDKMSAEEFAKSQEVMKKQVKRREEILEERAEEKAARDAKR
jgi:FtsZ-interacting cell division protein ZipA